MGDTAGFPLLSSAIATHHLDPFYSRMCQQNRHFNMCTKISKGNKVLRAKIFTKDALKPLILTDSIAKN